jgi:hypothetical protein
MSSFNVSTLFSSLNSRSTSISSFNFADYASIRNGSYRKLLKAYYSQNSKTSASSTSGTGKTSTSKTTDTTGLTKMKTVSESLKKSATELKSDELWESTGGSYNWNDITKAVKSFADDYNSVIEQSSNVNSSEVSQNVGYMESLTSTMQKALSKVGITVGTDNKLTVDEDALKKSDIKNVKSLFYGSYSYGGQVAQKASSISSSASRSTATYTSSGTMSSYMASMWSASV